MIDGLDSPGEQSALDRHRDELADEFLRVARAESRNRMPRGLLGRGGIVAVAAVVALATGIAVAATTGTNDRAPGTGPLLATIEKATDVTSTSATLNGAVNTDSSLLDGQAASYQYEYGADASYGNVTPDSPTSVGLGSGTVPVTEDLSGLDPGTVYHFRLDVITPSQTVHGLDRTFMTASP